MVESVWGSSTGQGVDSPVFSSVSLLTSQGAVSFKPCVCSFPNLPPGLFLYSPPNALSQGQEGVSQCFPEGTNRGRRA